MSTTKNKNQELIDEFKRVLEANRIETIYCVLRSVAKSGMSRRIDFYIIEPDANGKPWLRCISSYLATILGYSMHRNKPGVLVEGCGMDMGFHVVNSLGYALYPNDKRAGYKLRSEWV